MSCQNEGIKYVSDPLQVNCRVNPTSRLHLCLEFEPHFLKIKVIDSLMQLLVELKESEG